MSRIYFYIFKLTNKYIVINIIIITVLLLFINIIEISRLIDNQDLIIRDFIYLIFLKVPTTISETLPFVIVISIAFLLRNLINNNELIAMRNTGLSILDIFKPISLSIFFFGLFNLLMINPIAAKFEREFDTITSKNSTDIYSIKFINNEIWIKNILDDQTKIFFNINDINLNSMITKQVKILVIKDDKNKMIMAENAIISKKSINLTDVTVFDLQDNSIKKNKNLIMETNFTKNNIIDSISNYKFIPFYKYKEHISNLKKFNLHSSEVSLYYISEILKPIFLIVIGFVVTGFSGKYRRNENFFKVLFISIFIGFLIFLYKELVTSITASLQFSFIISYFIIFFIPLLVGLYQMIKIEKD